MSKGHIRRRGARDNHGNASWELKFDLGRDTATGKRRTRYASFYGTKRDAQAQLRALMGDADKGAYVEPSKITVAEHVRACLARWKGVSAISPKTAERYDELVERQIVPHIGATLVQKLKRAEVEGWYATLLEKGRLGGARGVSPRTIAHAHRVLRKALAEAVADDLVHKNAAALAKNRPKIEDAERVALTADQVKIVIDKQRGRSNYALFVTALFTGMRAGELMALRWAAIDLDGKTIEVRAAIEQTKKKIVEGEETGGIRFKNPKSRSGKRTITLPDIVAEALRERRKEILEQRMKLGVGKLPDDALVFPADDGGPRSVHVVSRAWRRAADNMKIVGVSFHGLRHTHASQLIDAGVDIVTISKRLGHAKPDITLKVYAHLFKQRDDKAAAAINHALSTSSGAAK